MGPFHSTLVTRLLLGVLYFGDDEFPSQSFGFPFINLLLFCFLSDKIKTNLQTSKVGFSLALELPVGYIMSPFKSIIIIQLDQPKQYNVQT